MRERKLTHIPVILGLLLLFAACHSDQPEEVEPEPSKGFSTMMRFTIAVPDNADITRAEAEEFLGENWGNYSPTDPGVEFDSKLTSSITAVLYSVNPDGSINHNNPSGVITDPTVQTKNENGNTYYLITGRLKSSYPEEMLKSGKFRMMVFTNYDAFDIKKPDNISFTRYGIPDNSVFTSIPMWGVGEADLSGLKSDGTVYDVQDSKGGPLQISLLRAMAQIRVHVSDAMYSEREVRLVKATLNRMNHTGFIVPGRWNLSANTLSLKLENTINAYSSPRDFSVSASDELEKKSICFYLPEIVNSTGEDEIIMTVEYSDDSGETHTGNIHFCRYVDGIPVEGAARWDIVRNHIYEYKIAKIQENYSLGIQVCVKQWKYRKITTEL